MDAPAGGDDAGMNVSQGVDAQLQTADGAPAAPSDIAWYSDGTVTGTASENNFATLGTNITADNITVAQIEWLMEHSKYGGGERPKTQILDFDEVFLSRAQNATFMSRLARAVTAERAAGWLQVIVYDNGRLSTSESVPGGWAAIASAGAMIGLESYSTTLWTFVSGLETQYGYADSADLTQRIAANQALYDGFKSTIKTYVESAKTVLGKADLDSHLTLLQFQNMSHDITAIINHYGWSTAKATDFAELWYAAMKAVAAEEGIRWGIYHPA